MIAVHGTALLGRFSLIKLTRSSTYRLTRLGVSAAGVFLVGKGWISGTVVGNPPNLYASPHSAGKPLVLRHLVFVCGATFLLN